jgi:monoamine oxidase
MTPAYDVVIIGAGLSGTFCASLLKKKGLRPILVEASSRIGGRLKSIRDRRACYELGGTYIGNSYKRVISTSNQLGLELIDVSDLLSFFKNQDLVIDGNIISQSEWPDHPKNTLKDELKKIMPWNLHRILLKKHNPFSNTSECLSHEASFYDRSMGDWLRSLGFDEEAIRLIYGMNSSYGCEANEISLLQLFHRASFSNAQSNKDRQSGLTLKEGMSQLAERLVEANSLDILLNHKVKEISNNSECYSVQTSQGKTVKAKFLVVTLPPSCIADIKIKDVMPMRLLALLSTLKSQPMMQVHFKIKNPFWDNDDYAPSLFSNDLFGMCHEVRQLDNPDHITGLTSWVMGSQAKKLLAISPSEAANKILDRYTSVRPSSKNNLKIDSIAAWAHDENFKGGWVYFNPGTFRAFHDMLPNLEDRFCLAGEYTARHARGMEGAMESGESAANKILSQLS